MEQLEISLLGCINQGGIFLMRLKFEHALLVRTCDVYVVWVSQVLMRLKFEHALLVRTCDVYEIAYFTLLTGSWADI